jgi:polyisoprenoid-binding protein YceI
MSIVETQEATGRQTWAIDPSHTSVEFSVKHMMITTVKGRFAAVDGTVTRNEDGEWTAEVRMDAASIDTRSEQRDEHLRSADFLDAASHPALTFRSRAVNADFDTPGTPVRIVGDLSIRGVTREVVLDGSFEGTGTDPWGGARKSFSASTKIDRRDYGLLWNQALEAGGVLVANDVKISLDVQLVAQF